MNHLQSNKLNLKTAQEEHKHCADLLTKHPGNAVLTRFLNAFKLIGKRCKDALDQGKKEGYSLEYEALWKLFDYRTGSKSEAYGAYCKAGVEHEVIMAAVKLYKADIKKGDVTQAHLTTWLNQKRWDSYDGLIEQVEKRMTCQICREHPGMGRISYYPTENDKVRHSSLSAYVCDNCKKYDGQVKKL